MEQPIDELTVTIKRKIGGSERLVSGWRDAQIALFRPWPEKSGSGVEQVRRYLGFAGKLNRKGTISGYRRLNQNIHGTGNSSQLDREHRIGKLAVGNVGNCPRQGRAVAEG